MQEETGVNNEINAENTLSFDHRGGGCCILLKISFFLVPTPGTTKLDPVKENFEAVTVELTDTEMWENEEALSHTDIVGMGR